MTDLKCMVPFGTFYLRFLSNFAWKHFENAWFKMERSRHVTRSQMLLIYFSQWTVQPAIFPIWFRLTYVSILLDKWIKYSNRKKKKKNKASRQPTSIWKVSPVIISASLPCLLERRGHFFGVLFENCRLIPPSWKHGEWSYLFQTSDFKTVSNRHEQRLLLRSKGRLVFSWNSKHLWGCCAACWSVTSL